MNKNNPLTFKIHKPKRVTLKQLEKRCNDLNYYFGYALKPYDHNGKPQRTYQISAAYGGYRLEFWSGRGGCVNQTFRTTAGQLYIIIDSIMLGCINEH